MTQAFMSVDYKKVTMTEKEYKSNTNWKMSYEEFKNAIVVIAKECIHRGTFRRVPLIDGSLGLCLIWQNSN